MTASFAGYPCFWVLWRKVNQQLVLPLLAWLVVALFHWRRTSLSVVSSLLILHLYLSLTNNYQYINVDRVCVCVHYGCDVTSATCTLGTRLQGLLPAVQFEFSFVVNCSSSLTLLCILVTISNTIWVMLKTSITKCVVWSRKPTVYLLLSPELVLIYSLACSRHTVSLFMAPLYGFFPVLLFRIWR